MSAYAPFWGYESRGRPALPDPGDIDRVGDGNDWGEFELGPSENSLFDAFDLDDERDEPEPEYGDFWAEPEYGPEI